MILQATILAMVERTDCSGSCAHDVVRRCIHGIS